MKTLRLLLVLLAVLTVGGVAAILVHREARSAKGLFDSARARLSSNPPDFSAALRELDLALELAVRDGDERIARNVLLRRGQVYEWRDAPGRALEDYQRVLDEIQPNDVGTLVRIGWLALDTDQTERAIATADRILELQPAHSGALFLRGRARHVLANGHLRKVEELLHRALADEPAAKGLALAWRAAVLPRSDPLRATALADLGAVLRDPALQEEIERHVDLAAAEAAEAFSSYAAAVEDWPNDGALFRMVQLLELAGRTQDVADLGLASFALPTFRRNVPALESLVRALQELSREVLAATVIERARAAEADFPDHFLPRWCEVLYESRRWARLQPVADLLVRRSRSPSLEPRRAAGLFYRGIAELELGRHAEAATTLSDFLRSPAPRDPIPGARVRAWLARAEAHRALLSPSNERHALEAALALDPEASADAWRRLAALQEEAGRSPADVARSLTRAVELAPERADELVPLWRATSERALAEEGRTPELVVEDLRRGERAVPVRWLPWECLRIAELWAERGDWRRADRALAELLDAHPRLAPALDLRIEALLARGRPNAASDLLLHRLRVAGPHPEILRVLGEIPPGVVGDEQRLRLMELDGENHGLRTVLEELHLQGKHDYAREVLRHKQLARLQDEVRIELSQLLLEAGEPGRAYEAASAVPEGSRAEPMALVLRVRAALSAGGEPALRALGLATRRLAEMGVEDPGAALAAARELLVARQSAAALDVLRPLDGAEGAPLDEVLVLLAQAHLLEGDPAAAELAILRAEAFREDGAPALLQLLAALDAERWSDVPDAALAAAQAEEPPTDLAATALLALQERVEEAAVIAAERAAEEERDLAWHALLAAANALLPEAVRVEPAAPPPYPDETARFAGDGERGRDPRVVLGILAAADVEAGGPWALARLLGARRIDGDETDGELWKHWLAARVLDRLGREDDAFATLVQLAHARSDFAPAWQEVVERTRLRVEDPLAPEVLGTMKRWANAAGWESLPPDELLLLRADGIAEKGDLDTAVGVLTPRAGEPGAPELVLVLLARLHERAGRPGAAVATWTRLLENADDATAEHHLPEVLRVLAAARAGGELTETAHRAHLAALAAQLPRDPLAAIALAEETIASAERSALAVTRARSDLEHFRERTEGVPIASLRPGAVPRWYALYERHDPVRAHQFARRELLARPGSPDLWILEGRGREARGEPVKALERYEALARIVPDHRALRRAAALLADTGAAHERVQAAITRLLDTSGGERTLAFEAQLLTARSLVRSGPPLADQGLQILRNLWAARAGLLRSGIDVRELGRLYAVALLQRGGEADAKTAAAVLEEALVVELDPLRRELFTVLRHLAGHLPAPEPGS